MFKYNLLYFFKVAASAYTKRNGTQYVKFLVIKNPSKHLNNL